MASTPEPPAPSRPAAQDHPPRLLGLLRGAAPGTPFIAAGLFAVVAVFPLLRGEPLRPNWAYPTWGGLMALACLAGAALAHLGTRAEPLAALPALRRVSGWTLLALAAGFAAVPIYLVVR